METQNQPIQTYPYKGKQITIREALQFCTDPKMNTSLIRTRLYNGWTMEQAISTPVHEYIDRTYFYQGREMSINNICETFGLERKAFVARLRYGWNIDDAIEIPFTPRPKKVYHYNGKDYTLGQLSKLSGLSGNLIASRLRHGKTIEDALNTPKMER